MDLSIRNQYNGKIMIKRALFILAAASFYIWVQRQQKASQATRKDDRAAESTWASEGGQNPTATI
jgi:hypothetical protein